MIVKPYILEMTTTVVVMADSPAHAMQVAREHRREMARDGDLEPAPPVELVALCGLRGGWNGECIPYGGDGNIRLKAMFPG